MKGLVSMAVNAAGWMMAAAMATALWCGEPEPPVRFFRSLSTGLCATSERRGRTLVVDLVPCNSIPQDAFIEDVGERDDVQTL
jgi:hypothetical protein